MSFHCDKCGLCCRMLANVPQLAAYDRGDGVCRFLGQDNLCTIYDKRPDICNVAKMYSLFSAQLGRDEYYKLMTQSCMRIKELQNKARHERIISNSTSSDA